MQELLFAAKFFFISQLSLGLFSMDYFLLDPDDDILVMDEFDDFEVVGYDSLPSISGAHWGKIGGLHA